MARDGKTPGVLRTIAGHSMRWFQDERHHGSPYIAWAVVLVVAAVVVLVVVKLVEAVLSVITILLLVALLVLVVVVATSNRRH